MRITPLAATTPPVLWTRGSGCAELAELLAEAGSVRVQGDLREACIANRAQVLVARKLSSLDLVSTVVPVDFDPTRISRVTAAVAGGPHSPLAAQVAFRLGEALGVEAEMVCAFRDDAGRERAVSLIEKLYRRFPGLAYRVVEAPNPGSLIEQLAEGSLLVIGAPGGNWFQRTLFGPGARLRQKAPSGAVVVRWAAPRVFQVMEDPRFVGPMRQAGDVLAVHPDELMAVVDRGRLIGVVRRARLVDVPATAQVSAFMEPPVATGLLDTVEQAERLARQLGGVPVPVVDGEVLVGTFVSRSDALPEDRA